MAQKLRLTCARTSYFDIELDVSDGTRPEAALAAAVAADPTLSDRGTPVGKAVYRIVEVTDSVETASALGPAPAQAA